MIFRDIGGVRCDGNGWNLEVSYVIRCIKLYWRSSVCNMDLSGKVPKACEILEYCVRLWI